MKRKKGLQAGKKGSCNFCGYEHAPDKKKCPAWGKICNRCKERNHFAKKCKKTLVYSIESEDDPVIGDLLPDLTDACVFTEVDLAAAFWHFVLDDESSVLTTFATPYGRFRWLRLPFGLNVSSEIFQKRLHQELEGLPGVRCIADDVLVYGARDVDHDRNLANFMCRCQQKGIKLNSQKLEFKCKEVPFHAHLLTWPGQGESEFETINMLKYLPISEERLLQIQRETENDESFQVLKAVIQ